MSDVRAAEIGVYLRAGGMSPDAEKCLAYAIQKLEAAGELEIFVSEEIDAFERTTEDSNGQP